MVETFHLGVQNNEVNASVVEAVIKIAITRLLSRHAESVDEGTPLVILFVISLQESVLLLLGNVTNSNHVRHRVSDRFQLGLPLVPHCLNSIGIGDVSGVHNEINLVLVGLTVLQLLATNLFSVGNHSRDG